MFIPINNDKIPKLNTINKKKILSTSNPLYIKDSQKSINSFFKNDEFILLKKDNIKNLQYQTIYYGFTSDINETIFDNEFVWKKKLDKIVFDISKSGYLRMRIDNSNIYIYPYIKEGMLVTSNQAIPIIIRAKIQSGNNSFLIPKIKKSTLPKNIIKQSSKQNKGILYNLLNLF